MSNGTDKKWVKSARLFCNKKINFIEPLGLDFWTNGRAFTDGDHHIMLVAELKLATTGRSQALADDSLLW